MARPQNTKVTQQPAILPNIPASVQGEAFFAGRTILSHHTDNGGTFQDNYTSTGIFPAPEVRQAKDTLIKGMSCYFDLDLVDLFESDANFTKALAHFAAQNITQVHVTSDGRAINLADVTTTPITNDSRQEKARQAVRKDVIKAWLTAHTEADLLAYCESIGGTYVDQLIAHIGKPNVITYTGTGLHVHYFISETEGWTEKGIAVAGDSTLSANLTEMKSAYKVLVREIARQNDGKGFDTARCDVGLGVSRNVGTTNQKHSKNIKDVVEIMGDKCDVNQAITLEDLTIEATSTSRKKSGGSARDRIKAAGNSGHDARVKRVKARLKADAEITYEYNGNEVTVSVDDLMEQWDMLKDQGVVQDDNGDKMKCRLDWVSNGSINAWCRKDDKDGSLTFICDVEKYLDSDDRHVFDDNGKLVGKWVYEGSLRSQLMVTPKGALVRNLHNIVIIMQLDPRLAGQLRFNNRTSGVEVSAEIHRLHRSTNKKFEYEASQNAWFPLTDAHASQYIKMAVESHFRTGSVNKDELYSAIEFVAGMNGHDEVQKWLDAIQWDGKQRLDGDNAWLCQFMGVNKADEPELFDYYEFVGRAMMLAIVRNIYAVDRQWVSTQHMALMRGGQNFGKSLMASILGACPYIGNNYFAEMNSDLLNRGSGDIIQALAGKTVIEIPELSAFSKKDAETVKNFITQRTIEGRKAYGRNVTRLEKSTYMIGNTNKYKPLTDSTGARRFLMIDFYNDYRKTYTGQHAWDKDALIALVPHLYAEARNRAVLGMGIPANRLDHCVTYCGVKVDNWNLSPSEVAILNEKNKAYTNLNAVTESVYDILDKLLAQGQTRTTLSAIRKELKEEYQITVQSNIQINEALSQKNWHHRRPGGIRCVEYQGEISEEQEARSVTYTTSTINAPRDVAKTGNESSQLTAMMQMMAEMKAQMATIMEENKALKAQLHAKSEQPTMRPEPRRKAPAKKKAAPAPKAVEFTLDVALQLLRDNGKVKLAECYEAISDDQPTRKANTANMVMTTAKNYL